MNAAYESNASDEIRHAALAKMSSVLGPERARQIMEAILDDLRIELRTPDDLLQFSHAMAELGGFEGAVGAMLGVTAVLRGARAATAGRSTP